MVSCGFMWLMSNHDICPHNTTENLSPHCTSAVLRLSDNSTDAWYSPLPHWYVGVEPCFPLGCILCSVVPLLPMLVWCMACSTRHDMSTVSHDSRAPSQTQRGVVWQLLNAELFTALPCSLGKRHGTRSLVLRHMNFPPKAVWLGWISIDWPLMIASLPFPSLPFIRFGTD